MKLGAKCLLVFLELCLPFAVSAQFSNSWIKFSQQYYKIPISQDGIYRLSHSNLQASGFPVDSIDPRFIQIFHRGKEQSIYVRGQADAVFNANDYIEFYGHKNDGTLDSLLYQPSSLQPHKYYNLYSDTSAYFLTYSYPQRGLRMDSVQIVNVNNLPPEGYQYCERLFVFHDIYSAGYKVGDTRSTYFDQGEGWTGNAVQRDNNKDKIDYVIDSLLNGVTGAGNPKLELLLVGRDYVNHDLQVLVGPNSGALRLLASPNFDGFKTYFISTDLNWSDIGADGKITLRLAISSAASNREQASISYAKISFPQNFNWGNQKKKPFRLEVKPLGSSYLSIPNPQANLRLWDITDLQNIVLIQPTLANPFNVIVPGTSVAKRMFSSSTVMTPRVIPISFRQINPANANFLIITNKVLRKSTPSYGDPVRAYAGYRATSAGGSYDTLVVTVDQLYNQFNYGETSPLAIYSFMKFMSQGNLKYLFLIGKGRDVIDYPGYQRKAIPSTEFLDLVPSAGYPGGDNVFTAGLNGSTYYPSVPTGRLTATTPAQVAAYLDKVKDIESQSLQPWAKQLLHLSGGGSETTDAYELNLFRQYVDGFKKTAEGPYLGGHVTTLAKANVGVEKINISPYINQGINLVTFYGHSSVSTIDIDIGYVSDPTLGYYNPKKYPVFLINGCNAGGIFANTVSFSEDWILSPGAGARNFIADTSLGLTQNLRLYSDLFYQVGFGDSTFITKGIGDIQKETCRRYLQAVPTNIYSISQIDQMVLAGDPALKLFGTNLPDYAIDNGSISIASLDSKPVTSLSDSFALKIIVKNLGAYKNKPMRLRVIRTFSALSNNSSKTYDSIISPVLYIDTLVFKLRKEKSIDGFGNNLFTVIIDPLNSVREINESNNIGTLSAFIPSNGTINLFPANFGIINSPSVNLVFQDANLLGSLRSFSVEFDTVSTFNSPFLKHQNLSGKVLVKTSPINLLSGDSTVYYWRTKPVKRNASDSSMWTTSSFIHISDSPEGWAQTKFPQLNNDIPIQLTPDTHQQKFEFIKTVTQISIKSIGATSTSQANNASMKIDGVEYNVAQQEGIACRNNTINLVAFNKQSAFPYPGISVYWNDARGCGLQPSVINSFTSSELQTGDNIDLFHYIDNITVSDSVVLYSVGNPAFSSWPSNALTKLNDLGISNTQITSLTDGEPVIIFGRKGAAVGTAKIFRTSASPATSQDLLLTSTITGRFTTGNIKSTVIGPAKKWVKFSAAAKNKETFDQISYSIFGVAVSGQETLLQSSIISALDLSFIDATKYPGLKIQVNVQDTINLTPAQVKNWFVFYESVAEGLLIKKGSLDSQSLHEGEIATSQYEFLNISSKSFSDSLQVSVETFNQTKAQTESSSLQIKAPAPGDSTIFSVSINTKGKAGLNDVSVFVNPKIQPEQFYENNVIGLTNFINVTADRSLPILDVTVDNRYLQDGDYVSSSPNIRVKLHDDNPFLFVTDTTHLNILVSYPCDTTPCPFKKISFTRSDVQWSPATASSDFTASFHPASLPQGIYTLQVSGTDATGNSSGPVPYKVNFEVKDETLLTLKSVYPNPSNDLYNFNFVLAGNELPDDFSLQLYATDGQLLRQFSLNDVTGFVVGSNTINWSAVSSGVGNGLIIYRLKVGANGKTASQSGRLLLIK